MVCGIAWYVVYHVTIWYGIKTLACEVDGKVGMVWWRQTSETASKITQTRVAERNHSIANTEYQ